MADLLRETFREYAERAPGAEGLAAAVAARSRAYRARRRWATAAGAVAAAAVVFGVVAVAGVGERPRPGVLLTEPAAPAGTRWVLWHGVEVAVPVAWFEGTFDACGTPRTDALLVNDPPGDDCASEPSPDVDVAYVVAADGAPVEGLGRSTDVVVSGVPARRMVGTFRGRYAEGVVVPSQDAAVVVVTDDPAVARRVLDTVRVRPDVDSRGCAVSLRTPYAAGPPARAGARDRMVPGAPLQASVCRYMGGRAVVSVLADADRARALAATFNGLPPGFSPAEPNPRGVSFVVTFRYAGGPDVVVHVNPWGDRDVGASNGAVTGQVTDALEDALRPLAGWSTTHLGVDTTP